MSGSKFCHGYRYESVGFYDRNPVRDRMAEFAAGYEIGVVIRDRVAVSADIRCSWLERCNDGRIADSGCLFAHSIKEEIIWRFFPSLPLQVEENKRSC